MSLPRRILLAVVVAVLVWLALDLLLLIFAGILLAVFLRTLAQWVSAFIGLGVRWALALVLLSIVGAIGAAAAWYAPAVAEQVDQLTETLPQAITEVTGWARQYAWGRWLLDSLSQDQTAQADVAERAARAAGTVFSAVVGAIIVLFIGLYLAADPAPYVRGALRLVPPERRRRVAEVLFAVGYVLRWWLVGQAIAMALVGIAMGIGFAIIGVPLALTLGVLAGLFEFIPFLGPILGVGPALLLTLADSPDRAVYVLLLYGIVQTAEGYIVTPLVQRRVVHLPPVVTIVSQVAMTWAAGAFALLLAVPLVAAVLVAVQMLYIEGVLREPLPVEAEDAGRDELRNASMIRDLVDDPEAQQAHAD